MWQLEPQLAHPSMGCKASGLGFSGSATAAPSVGPVQVGPPQSLSQSVSRVCQWTQSTARPPGGKRGHGKSVRVQPGPLCAIETRATLARSCFLCQALFSPFYKHMFYLELSRQPCELGAITIPMRMEATEAKRTQATIQGHASPPLSQPYSTSGILAP